VNGPGPGDTAAAAASAAANTVSFGMADDIAALGQHWIDIGRSYF
jgi:hypothetical protein